MRLFTATVVLALCLAIQTGLGRVWPEAPRYVDMMMVPVVWYAVAGSQRSGMLVGCAAGLMQDAWFQAGAFGISGFKKTLVGWVVGGLATRFEVSGQATRFVFGLLASLGDSLLDLGLRHLLDQTAPPPRALDVALKAVTTAVLVVGAFALTRWSELRRERRSIA